MNDLPDDACTDEDAPAAEADEATCQGIDHDALDALKDVCLPEGLAPWAPADAPAGPGAPLETVQRALAAMDARLSRIEQAQGHAAAMLDHLQQYVAYLSDQQAQTIGHRRGLLAIPILEAVAPCIDRIRGLRRSLDDDGDSLTVQQLNAVVELLTRILDNLGFTPMAPTIGEPFDPHRMQCDGFTEGEHGKVLAVTRPGYLAGDTVARVAGVLIASGGPGATEADTEPAQADPEDTENETAS